MKYCQRAAYAGLILSIASFGVLATAARASAAGGANPRRAIVAGGGCETGPNNGFFDDLAFGSAALKSSGWDVRILYAGPEARCGEAGKPCPKGANQDHWSVSAFSQIAGQSPEQIKEATRSELYQALDSACAEMPSGSEVLLVINTHGGPIYSKMNHTLCLAAAPDSKFVADLLDTTDRSFQDKLACIHDKGIRLGIIDESCYGGASVANLSRFGCVLSGTTASTESHEIQYENGAFPRFTQYIGSSILPNLVQLLKFQKPAFLKQVEDIRGVTLDTVFERTLGQAVLSADFPESSAFMSEMYDQANALAKLHEDLFSAISDTAFMTSDASRHPIDFTPAIRFAASLSSNMEPISRNALARSLWSIPDRASKPTQELPEILAELEESESRFEAALKQIRQIGPAHHEQWADARYHVMDSYEQLVDQARLLQYLWLKTSVGARDTGLEACSAFVLSGP